MNGEKGLAVHREDDLRVVYGSFLEVGDYAPRLRHEVRDINVGEKKLHALSEPLKRGLYAAILKFGPYLI